MRKKVMILFPSAHIAYAPTIINLYDALAKRFEVCIVSLAPEFFGNRGLRGRNVTYYRMPAWRHYLDKLIYRLFHPFSRLMNLFKKNGFPAADYFHAFPAVRKNIERENPDLIIAVDSMSLWICQFLGRKPVFLSLEIRENDPYLRHADPGQIEAVVIQTPERYRFLFGDRELPTYFLPNAPVFTEPKPVTRREGLVYCGTAWDEFGIYHCLDFLREDASANLTIKGMVFPRDKRRISKEYADLLESNRLRIDDSYLEEGEMQDYLSRFRIGFCFYNFSLPHVNRFNYRSAPSGKLFKYYAAGVPVIGVNVSGLQSVRDFDCGILLEDLSPASIRGAVTRIESDFGRYSANCLRAARHFNFDRHVEPLIGHLQHHAPGS